MKYRLDLTEYAVTIKSPERKPVDGQTPERIEHTVPYPLRDNVSGWLRTVGVFKTAEDVAEAVTLAKRILACSETAIELDQREAGILKAALDRFIEWTAEGRANVGGEIHEEAILRVVNMEKIDGGTK